MPVSGSHTVGGHGGTVVTMVCVPKTLFPAASRTRRDAMGPFDGPNPHMAGLPSPLTGPPPKAGVTAPQVARRIAPVTRRRIGRCK
jgi:hypothetical protein